MTYMSIEQMCKLAEKHRIYASSNSSYKDYRLIAGTLVGVDPKAAVWCGWQSFMNEDPKRVKSPWEHVYPKPAMIDEGTYDGCTDWELQWPHNTKSNELELHVTCYDGDSLYGDRKERRAEWVYEVTSAPAFELLHRQLFLPLVLSHLRVVAAEIQRRTEEAAYKAKVQKRFDDILSEFT